MPNTYKKPLMIDLDLAIIGGGVAGLWLINCAQKAGYSCALFDSNGLGSGQSLASQGMIHGGMKYTLGGALSGASEAIASMPSYWYDCLKGEGELDLRQTQLLCDHFFLWSNASASSRLATFLASKLIRGRADPVAPEHRPELLRHKEFTGSLYRINDLVLDVPSLLANLVQTVHEHLFAIDWEHSQLQLDSKNRAELQVNVDGNTVKVRARRVIFTAGQGNADLLEKLGLTHPEMQIRPLHQVMVKHSLPHRFYGHCLGADTTPRLTLSSHPTLDGKQVWYLGGSLAEKGVAQSSAEVIASAQQELSALMPWLTLQDAEWASLRVNRAEPRQVNFARPDNAFATRVQGANNLIVAWPTKLTLAPNLAQQVLNLLAEDNIQPSTPRAEFEQLRQYLPEPRFAPAPWDIAFGSASNNMSHRHEA